MSERQSRSPSRDRLSDVSRSRTYERHATSSSVRERSRSRDRDRSASPPPRRDLREERTRLRTHERSRERERSRSRSRSRPRSRSPSPRGFFSTVTLASGSARFESLANQEARERSRPLPYGSGALVTEYRREQPEWRRDYAELRRSEARVRSGVDVLAASTLHDVATDRVEVRNLHATQGGPTEGALYGGMFRTAARLLRNDRSVLEVTYNPNAQRPVQERELIQLSLQFGLIPQYHRVPSLPQDWAPERNTGETFDPRTQHTFGFSRRTSLDDRSYRRLQSELRGRYRRRVPDTRDRGSTQ